MLTRYFSQLEPGGAVPECENTRVDNTGAKSRQLLAATNNSDGIGAGSLVLNDIPDDALAYGWPARLVRSLSHG
jgi:hypothetical protein